MQVTAKSLVLDLLSTMRGGSMPVALLVSAAEAFGLDGNRTRVALTRLLSQGLVERDERGHYRLGPGSGSTLGRVASWRNGATTRPWQGGWLATHIDGIDKSDRSARRITDRALGFFSFRALNPGLMIRPDNLSAKVDGIRDELAALGADPRISCFCATSLSSHDEERARALWDLEALRSGYDDARDSMRRSRRRLAALDEEAAMVESFIVGGKVIRLLVLDPLLPDDIFSGDTRRLVTRELREYDQLGRACWAPLLQRHGVRVKADPGRLGTIAGATAIGARSAAAESSPLS
jgi:phenylacetic acid degradation operon negative regulatory protein